MAERKAFISPYWAICIGCVFAALFAFFVIAPAIANPFDRKGCNLKSDQIAAAMEEGASEVLVISDEMEVTRALAWVIDRDVDPPYPTTVILYAIYPKTERAEIYYADGAWVCGYSEVANLETGRAFLEYVKNLPGQPA